MKTVRRWLFLAILVTGCTKQGGTPRVSQASKPLPSAFTNSLLVDLGLETADSARDPRFVLVATDPANANALLWSGSLGVNFGPYGSAFDFAGKALPSFSSAIYDIKENILPQHTPLDVTVVVDGKPVTPLKEGYWQSLNMRYGLLTSHWFANVTGGLLEVRATSFVDGGELDTRWEFKAPKGTELTISMAAPLTQNRDGSILVGRSITDSESGNLWEKAKPGEVPTVKLESGEAVWLNKYVCKTGVLSEASWYHPHHTFPLKPKLVAAHKALDIGPDPRIEIDGPLDDQQAVNSFIFYLQTSTQPGWNSRISPFGLSSDRYNGHVFWDADVWVMPALAFVDPTILQSQVDYRVRLMQKPPLAPFPWESSVSGKEVSPTDTKKEIHISGSVLWGLEFAAALGAKVPGNVVKDVADYYVGRATKRPDGKLGLEDVMSPDEGHTGSNDLYTNLLAQWAINGATWNPSKKPTEEMFLPQDATSFLTYDNDKLKPYKQAAAVLAIYPLQYPPAEAEAKTMMARFQDKIIPHGPAMADSIHATIRAREGEPDKAYDLWKKSWSEFVQGPLFLFSEKRTSPTTYFTTGAAGCLQSVIYGFLGFRVDEKPEPGASWTKQLKNGRWLSIKPNLPSAWKSVTFRNFHVLGSTYTLTVKREGSKTVTSVKQGD